VAPLMYVMAAGGLVGLVSLASSVARRRELSKDRRSQSVTPAPRPLTPAS